MENLIIDDESLKQIKITTTQRVYRKFAMALKGTQQVLGLRVFKKGSQESLSMKATEMKTSLKGTKAVCGLIQGDNKEKCLMFLLPGSEEVLEKMGIGEKSYICSVNPYPVDILRKNIKDSNADFNKAEFKIVDSIDDPIFGSADLARWDEVKSSVDVASFYLINTWKTTLAEAERNPDQVDTQWDKFSKAQEGYTDFVKEVTALVIDFMDADAEKKSVFVETMKVANDKGIYDTSKLEEAIEV